MKRNQSHRSVFRRQAFTLIEVLVATVIMVILVGLVIQITSQVLQVWNRSSGRLSANAEARIAMDLITQDLETAVFRNNGQQWLRVEGPTSVSGNYDSQTVALKLFSPALDRDKFEADGVTPIPGDICAIGYRLEFQPSYTGGESVYALYRAIEDPDNTFNNLMGSGSSGPQLLLQGGTFWPESNLLDVSNYLASNIVDFRVLIYQNDGTNLPVNANADFEPTGNYAYGGSDATLTSGAQQSILYADVILKVVSDEGLEILQLPNFAGTGFEDADAVVQEHGQVFTRRVYFPARPL